MKKDYFIYGFVFIVMVLVCWGLFKANQECNKSGGVLVKSVMWYECINK